MGNPSGAGWKPQRVAQTCCLSLRLVYFENSKNRRVGEQLCANCSRKRAAESLGCETLRYRLPGVGPFIAGLLIDEVGDAQRFPTAKHLASYTRLVPSLYASGEHRWGGAITQQGSTVLRWAPMQAAHRKANSPQFQDYCQRQRERHGAGKATITLAHKLVVITYYRWRQALHAARPPAKVEKVRECSWGRAWSEDRPSMSD